jgi:hypothetical protein
MNNEQTMSCHNSQILCPSTQPSQEFRIIFGVVAGTAVAPQVHYLQKPQPATPELLAKSAPVKPTEIFRIAGNCYETNCQHFDGADCRLVQKIVRYLPEVVSQLPPCQIRAKCRWWNQEGKSACLRCPQILTEVL